MTNDPKTVLITGASSGIGSATATRLAADGHHVVLGARRTERLHALVDQIRDAGGSATAAAMDVTDRKQMADVVDAVVAERGSLDVLVNNAGVMPLSRLDALLVDEWDRMLDVNVRGLLHGIAAALPHFRRQGHGHFVTTASTASHEVAPTAAVYCGSKYAAWAITEGLRKECDPSIRVTTITPGVVESELAESISDPAARAFAKQFRANSIPPSAVSDAIAYALGQPAGVDINEIVLRPTAQR